MGNLKTLRSATAAFLVLAIAMTGCQPEIEGSYPTQYPLKLTFNNVAGTNPLVLGNTYNNILGEDITITAFKYYVSNISLVDIAGNETAIPGTYFLIDQNNPSSTSFEISAPDTIYKSVRFLLGVDSARNVSGVQTGALDPANGMFWTWNTGYIMAKMEGTSTVSPAPLSAVTYHIGGFKTGESVLKEIALDLPQPVILKNNTASEVIIEADALRWFYGTHDISIAADASSMEPGPLAMKIADNYAEMFSVAEVKNK